MRVRNAWDEDEISFSGFGSAHAVSDHVPLKPKKRHPVGFAPPSTKTRRIKL